MDWYPPRLITPVEPHVFGGRAIMERLGRRGLPDAVVSVIAGGASQWLGRVQIQGQVDVLIGYLPDLERDVREPLAAAGYAPEVTVALGDGLGH